MGSISGSAKEGLPMKMGALLGPVLDPSQNGFLAEQARRYEGEGFAGLWMAQAIGRGFMLTDPFVALSQAAAVTTEVKLGTAVLQLPLYHPADVAHRVLSLQQVSGERLVLGVGAGSTASDFAMYDREYAERFSRFDQCLKELRSYLDTGSCGGKSLSPWPETLGRTPLYLGSWGKGVERAADAFDGWIASAAYRTPDEVCDAHARYRAAGGGRAVVSTIQVSGETDLGELREKLTRFDEAGFDEAVVMLLPGAPAPGEVRRLIS